MCYTNNDRPPEAPGAVGRAAGEELALVSADGTTFSAYVAWPEGGDSTAQVVIFPDIRGLHDFYKDLCRRFAEKGISALALDFFGRTAGTTLRTDDFEFMPHVMALKLPQIMADASAGLAYLREGAGSEAATFALGFCIGGALSLSAGTEDLNLSGLVAFYPGFNRRIEGSKGTALETAGGIRCPVLGLFGGADQGLPDTEIAKLESALDGAGIEHELVTYPGAPHSFFDRKAVQFAQASADAWNRVLAFISSHQTART